MKFVAEKSDLLKNAQNAERGVPTGTASLPVLICVRLDVDEEANTLTIRGTDLSFSVSTSMTVRAEKSGTVCVNAKIFTSVLKSLEGGAVTIDVDNAKNSMKVSSGPSHFELRTVASNEFPSGEKFDSGNEIFLGADKFVKGLRKVIGASSSDAARPILTGVHFIADKESGTLSFAATDSYRLAVVNLSGLGSSFTEDTQVTVPKKTLEELIRFIDPDEAKIGVIMSEKSLQFRVGTTRFSTRLIEGNYPAYEKLLSVDANYTLPLDTENMVTTLKRVQIMNDPNAVVPARFDFDEDGLRVSCSKMDVGVADERLGIHLESVNTDTVDSDSDSEEGAEGSNNMSIGFNPKYMVEGLNAFGGEPVVLHINNELKPVLVTSATVPELQYILMPVRL